MVIRKSRRRRRSPKNRKSSEKRVSRNKKSLKKTKKLVSRKRKSLKKHSKNSKKYLTSRPSKQKSKKKSKKKSKQKSKQKSKKGTTTEVEWHRQAEMTGIGSMGGTHSINPTLTFRKP